MGALIQVKSHQSKQPKNKRSVHIQYKCYEISFKISFIIYRIICRRHQRLRKISEEIAVLEAERVKINREVERKQVNIDAEKGVLWYFEEGGVVL